ncbi:MAG: class I SAM-dependent rRNA methyltransferase [Patescibacteria group bacterium]|mgnify:CR=1 FL=1
MKQKNVILKPSKDKPIRNRHHWIFSGAVKSMPEFVDGDILGVESATGDFLGYGYFHHQTSITGRMLSFDKTPAEEAVKQNLDRAIAMRLGLFDPNRTNAYRLVHSEGDGIPGLIVDQYNDVLVFQATTLGIERLKPLIIEHLVAKLKPRSIYEKSTSPSRREEGLKDGVGILFGDTINVVEIKENGMKFIVDIVGGQKTGFFLDQRGMREYVGELAKGKKVLNCFGYTGGFSVAALAGGASWVDTVDQDKGAIELAKHNVTLNNLTKEDNEFFTVDVFQFLEEGDLSQYELIILDPPAFAKKKTDVVTACRGYKEINRRAIERISKGGILVTSSCSYHVDEKLFQTVIFQAARDANRSVKIIGRHRHAPDHPINIFHPEGEYLKSLVLYVG